MKSTGFVATLPFLVCTSFVLAQENPVSPEQEAAIRAIAEDVSQACTVPPAPAIPDGNTATEDDMLTAQQALKTYLDSGNTYLGCLEEVETGWGDGISDNQAAVVNFLYNRMVTDLQSGAAAFNTQLGVYRDRAAD